MNYLSTLKKMNKYLAVSGNENKLAVYLKSLFKDISDEVKIDDFYNVIALKRGISKHKLKIVISNHIDQIGFLVTSIGKDGFIRFTNIGGIDPKILLAQEVIIHGKEDILGIIGSIPPHLINLDPPNKHINKIENLFIDTGMTSENLNKLISIGDIITFKTSPFMLGQSKLNNKALDNQCGTLVILEVATKLLKLLHQEDIYYVSSVQEEVGHRGAVISTYNLCPDIAIIIDACFGDFPNESNEDTYKLGKGPVISIGPNFDKKLANKIISTAKEENIPYNIDVEAGNSGTDAWAIQVSRLGIPTALISIPTRYMHTAIETVDISDIKNAVNLIVRFIETTDFEKEQIKCF